MKQPSRIVLSALCVALAAFATRGQSITTVAGGGTLSQDGLPARSVILSSIAGLAADRNGNVYISEPAER